MPVDIPIDEVKAITLKVSPTYHLDRVESVTLKSFRKVVGYDTFNSILKKDRDEKKDSSDHYNVTVSMMIQRIPEDKSAPPLRDPYDGSKTLSETLDKGFPYDDADNQPDDQVAHWKDKKVNPATLVGKLNGENITKESLVNLVRDTDSPITNGLVQLDADVNSEIESKGNDFALMDNNVTITHLKNLVIDKPAPITVKLAQVGGNDFALMDNNVTIAHLKNLVIDKPAPITVKLAQVMGNDFALMDNNVTTTHLKNLVIDKPAPITVKLAQVKGNDFALMDNNVTTTHLKNLVIDKPAPITVKLAQIEKDDKMKNL